MNLKQLKILGTSSSGRMAQSISAHCSGLTGHPKPKPLRLLEASGMGTVCRVGHVLWTGPEQDLKLLEPLLLVRPLFGGARVLLKRVAASGSSRLGSVIQASRRLWNSGSL